jgi:hypothetical protein
MISLQPSDRLGLLTFMPHLSHPTTTKHLCATLSRGGAQSGGLGQHLFYDNSCSTAQQQHCHADAAQQTFRGRYIVSRPRETGTHSCSWGRSTDAQKRELVVERAQPQVWRAQEYSGGG